MSVRQRPFLLATFQRLPLTAPFSVERATYLIWGSRPGGDTEEVGHVVSKASIVSVLLDGHDLNGIVSEVPDPREHVLLELQVGAHLGLLARHAHVALVNAQIGWLGRPVVLELVLFVLLVDAGLARFLRKWGVMSVGLSSARHPHSSLSLSRSLTLSLSHSLSLSVSSVSLSISLVSLSDSLSPSLSLDLCISLSVSIRMLTSGS